jgi:excisionase family DNA binding protein
VSATERPAPRPEYLTSAEVAALYRVSIKQVALWARDGKLTAVRTPGGRYRFPSAQFAGVIGYVLGGAKS